MCNTIKKQTYAFEEKSVNKHIFQQYKNSAMGQRKASIKKNMSGNGGGGWAGVNPQQKVFFFNL